jgi:outer membrane beta-barrel protein
MRTQNTKNLGILILSFTMLGALPAWGQGKTDKYKRPQSKAAAPAEPGKDGDKKTADAPAAEATASPDKKVDLSDLESRYWTAKDTEFSVVQNRLYTKAKRLSVTLFGGPLLTESYTNSWNVGGAVNYYFSERHGIELHGWKTSATPSEFVTSFSNRFGAQPDFNFPLGYVGVNYNWIPIYAKLSLLEKKILYFDMSVSPGIGVTFMEANAFATPPATNPPVTKQSPITLAVDIAQQVFLDEHWALRIDLRNHLYQEKIYLSNTGAESRSKITYYGTIMFGVTFFQ